GVTFANAQCPAPVCNPSRCAIFSGLRPSTSGIYEDAQGRPTGNHILTRTTSMPDSFRERGYKTAGGGKVFAASFGSLFKNRIWDETMDMNRKGRMEDPRPPEGKLPLSLLDLYPTLLELAELPAKPDLDGLSIVPLLKNPSATWERPALTTAGFKNHALRTERWRYIRYADGSEELYDHVADPLERSNVASKPEFASVKSEMQKWLPPHDEPRN